MDRLRLVTLSSAGRPVVVADLNALDEVAGGIYRERDAFKFTPPARRERVNVGHHRHAGAVARDAVYGNATVTDRLVVRGGTGGNVAARLEALVAQVERLRLTTPAFIEWRPETFTRSILFRIVGPGTWAPVTNVRRLTARGAQAVDVSWPVAPLGEGLEVGLREHWPSVAGAALADEYGALGGAALPASPDAQGLHPTPAQRLVFDRGYAIADGEVEVVNRLDTLASGAANFFLAAGLRYQAADGRYVWATVEGGSLVIYYFDGANTGVGAVAHGQTLDAGEEWTLRLRSVGNDYVASLFAAGPPAPGAAPAATVTATVTPGHAVVGFRTMGAGRVGQPIPVAWGMGAGGTYTMREWSFRPYMRRGVQTPHVLRLDNVPGNAPAAVDVHLFAGTGGAAVPFGLVSLRQGGGATNGPFGILAPGNAALGDGFAAVADGAELTGIALDLNVGADGAASATWVVDPNAIADALELDTGGALEVEFYACGVLPATVTNPRLALSAAPDVMPGGRIWTREHGPGGRALPRPASGSRRRTWRLGTLSIPKSADASANYAVRLDFTGGGAGTFRISYVLAVIRPASSPTGKVNDATYPAFLPASAVTVWRRVRSSLAGAAERLGFATTLPGLGGSDALELAPGANDVLVWMQSGAVPDDPTVNDAAAADVAADVYLSVRPRYRLWRPS